MQENRNKFLSKIEKKMKYTCFYNLVETCKISKNYSAKIVYVFGSFFFFSTGGMFGSVLP